MLFGGRLFGGQLFIGNLYGGTDAPVAPPPPVLPSATGGRAVHPRFFWPPMLAWRPRATIYQDMIRRDEEDVILAVLAAFIQEQDRSWDH